MLEGDHPKVSHALVAASELQTELDISNRYLPTFRGLLLSAYAKEPTRHLRELRGHLALLAGPADGPGHLKSVVGDGSTCSKLASSSVHVVSAYAEVIRVGALRRL